MENLLDALGWLASRWRERQLEGERRAEKFTDVQTALWAEIDSNLTRYSENDLDADAAAMNSNILGDGKFTPFVPRYVTEIVFEAIIADILILPTETIGYHKQEYKLRELVEDLRSDKYELLAQARKARIYADYVWQIKTVLLAGGRAKAALGASLCQRRSVTRLRARTRLLKTGKLWLGLRHDRSPLAYISHDAVSCRVFSATQPLKAMC